MLRTLSAIALFAFVVSLGLTSGCGKDGDGKGGPAVVTPDPAMKDMKIKMKPGTGGGDNKEAKGGKAE